MTRLLERVGGFFPAAVALALPVVFAVPGVLTLSDLFILPRASIVIAGACIGMGLVLLTPATNNLGALRWPLAAAALAALLAFVFSVSWPLSFIGSYTRYESLPTRLSYLGLLASAALLVRSELQRRAFTVAYVFGCSVAAVEALDMAFSHVAFRPDGNLGNANLLAALLVMALPLAADRAWRSSRALEIAAWSASVVVIGAGLLVSTSRSGYAGAIAALAALLTLSVPRRASVPVGAISASIVTALLLAINFSPLRALNGDPPELRLHLWGDALRMVFARPLTGWGEDTTGLMFGRFLSQDYASGVQFDRVHSGPLDVATTQGLLGLAATGLVVGLVLLQAWRNRSLPGVAAPAGALVGYSVWVFFNFDWSPATGAFWLLAGVLWSSIAPLPSGERVRERGPLWRQSTAFVLALLVLPLAVFPILADAWYVKGRADLAVRVDPLQAQYHAAAGTLAELRTAAALGDTDPGLYVALGDAELLAGHRTEAVKAYKRALEIDPWYTPAVDKLAALGD